MTTKGVNQHNDAESELSQADYLAYRGFSNYFSVKVHGTKAAVEVKPDRTKAQFHTVRIEAAKATGPKSYDWSDKAKIAIQVTRDELPVFISCMFTLLDSCEFKNHNSKGFSVEFQQSHLFLKAFSGQVSAGVCAIPLTFEQAVNIGHLALSQYIANFPSIDGAAALQNLKLMSRRIMKTKYKA